MSHPASCKADSLKRSVRALLRRPPAALAMLGLPGLALAGPTGEDVVRGDADVRRPDANNTVIDQHTDRAVINWQTFNVDADEFVLFNQLDSSSIVLNRVLGGDMSRILGQMQANGQVFLLNPQGVFFADGATLDVQGFLGSTLDMDPDSFMAGDYALTRSADSPSTAAVVNDGQINAGPGGYVVLAGDFTENTGIITANAGTVALVSGNALALDIEGDGLVSFTVDEATLSENAGVNNAGSLIADGGMVVMTAKVANDLVATAVNNEGLVRARSVEERDGEIWLVGNGGDVHNHGTLDADGEHADGGRIMMYSDRNMTLADGAVQTAAGDGTHAGGFMRFVAENDLDYQQDNTIRATGGTSGGFVEVSGHNSINLAGIPQIGAGGELLVDPQHIALFGGGASPAYSSSNFAWAAGTPSYYQPSEDVTSVGTTWLAGQLDAGVNVSLVASEAISWNSSFAGNLTATGNGNLSLAIGEVSAFNPGASFGLGATGGVFSASPTVVETTDPDTRQIQLGSLDINIAGDLDAGVVGNSAGALINFGNVDANNIDIDAGSASVAGNVTLGTVNATGNVTITGNNITAGYYQTANNLTINGEAGGTNFYVGSSGTTVGSSSGNVGNVTVNGFVTAGNVWVNVAQGGSINISDVVYASGSVALTTGVNQATPSGSINLAGISNTTGPIDITTGQVNVLGGQLWTGNGNVTINGDLGGSNVSIGSSLGRIGGDIQVNGDINVNGDFAAWIGSGMSRSINLAGALNATGNVTLDASGSYSAINAGNISGGNIKINASTFSYPGADITVGTISGNSLTISATGGSMSGGGNVTATGNISVSGDVSITADAGAPMTGSGGNINLQGVSGNNVTLNTWGNTSFSGFANITAGNINASGNVVIRGNYGSNHVLGDISARHVDAHFTPTIDGNVNVSMGNLSANGTASGSRDIVVSVDRNPDGMSSSANLVVNSAQAQNGAVDLRMLTDTFNAAGTLTVNNGIQAGGDVLIQQGTYTGAVGVVINGNITGNDFRLDANSFTLGGNITAAGDVNILPGTLNISGQDINAGGQLDIFSSNSTGTMSFGNLRAADIAISNAGANIVTGTVKAINSAGAARIWLDASGYSSGGDIIVNGDIIMQGRGNSYGEGAILELETATTGGHSITVTGSTSITTTADSFFASYEGPTSAGTMGRAGISIIAGDGSVQMGNIDIIAVGEAYLDIDGANVSVGDIAVDVADGNITRTFNQTYCSFVSCSLDVALENQDIADAHVRVTNGSFAPGAALTFGNVTINGGDARFGADGYAVINGGSISLRGDGSQYSMTSTGTFDGQAVNYTESGFAGGAALDLQASSAGTVTLSGPVQVQGRGVAEVRVLADVIDLRGVTAEASSGTFERSGSPAGMHGDGDGPFGHGGGPRIDEGTMTGGFAHISLGNHTPDGSWTPAGSVDVGAMTATAPGNAGVEISAGDITVSGAITISGGHRLQQGTYSHEYFDSATGSSVTVAGTVSSSYGEAGMHIEGYGDVRLGDVSLAGPNAGGSISGQNVRVGAITITASGGTLAVDETRTFSDGGTERVTFDGPGTISGMDIEAGNALDITGEVNLSAPGAGGLLLSAAAIRTQDISIDISDGSYTVLDPDTLGAGTRDFVAGNAVLGIRGATAEITGDVQVRASQGVHFGGNADVTGDFTIQAGGAVTSTVPDKVQALDNVGRENEGDEGIVLPPSGSIRAANIAFTAGTAIDVRNHTLVSGNGLRVTSGGNMNLGGARLSADAVMLESGANMRVSGITIDAGTLQMTADGSIRNSNPAASITADAAAISAGSAIDLSNTALAIGSGEINGINGDVDFLQLMSGEGLDAPQGGPSLYVSAQQVQLGNLDFDGEYLFLEADSLTLAGTVSTSDPNLLVQLAPISAAGSFTLEQSSASGSGTSYTYDNALDAFAGATLALGTTGHTGDVSIGANSTVVDIGNTNLFVLTTGTVEGLDKVLSTGIVKDLATLLGLGFSTPQTDEIDAMQDPVQTLNNDYALDDTSGGEEEEEGDEEGEDTDTDADGEEEDDSLIRRSTSDEEMMCR